MIPTVPVSIRRASALPRSRSAVQIIPPARSRCRWRCHGVVTTACRHEARTTLCVGAHMVRCQARAGGPPRGSSPDRAQRSSRSARRRSRFRGWRRSNARPLRPSVWKRNTPARTPAHHGNESRVPVHRVANQRVTGRSKRRVGLPQGNQSRRSSNPRIYFYKYSAVLAVGLCLAALSRREVVLVGVTRSEGA